MIKEFDKLPQIARVILFIPIWGWLVSGVYRIVKFCEESNRNVLTLVIGILCLCTGVIGAVMSIIDLITTALNDKVTILAQ